MATCEYALSRVIMDWNKGRGTRPNKSSVSSHRLASKLVRWNLVIVLELDQIPHTQSMAESGLTNQANVHTLLKPLHNIGKTKKQNCSQIYT